MIWQPVPPPASLHGWKYGPRDGSCDYLDWHHDVDSSLRYIVTLDPATGKWTVWDTEGVTDGLGGFDAPDALLAELTREASDA